MFCIVMDVAHKRLAHMKCSKDVLLLVFDLVALLQKGKEKKRSLRNELVVSHMVNHLFLAPLHS